MKNIIFFLLLASVGFGCKESNPAASEKPLITSGKVAFTFDKAHTPSAVKTLTTLLSRSGYSTIEKTLNIANDTSATILFEQIAVGTWKVKVDAKNENGLIIYTGQSEIIVLENTVSQVNLVLSPVSSGVGSVQINVTWETNLESWIDLETNPVLSKPNNSSIIYGIHTPKILRDNGKYYMWYSMGTPQGGVGVAKF